MARLTVTEIMQQVAATVNQEAIAPAATSTEWGLWLSFLNRGYQEWAESSDWEALKVIYWPTVISSTVTMPNNFRKLAGPPILYGSLENGESLPEVHPEDLYNHNSTDKFVTVNGNNNLGYILSIYPATLNSGASISIPYFSTPTALSSSADIPFIGDSQFLVDRTIAYIFEGRSDSRFQIEETKARERLLNMVENNNLSKYNSYAGGDYMTTPTQRSGFRIGRD